MSDNIIEISEASIDTQANIYFEKYGTQMDSYESHSVKSQIGESLSPYEVVALGRQLDQFVNYTKFCESQGSLASLGAIPQIALDVITASVGASVLPLLASIQPMTEEHGIVYYKSIRAGQTKGGYTKGDTISSPLALDNVGDGTLGGNRKKETLATTVTGTTNYTGTLSGAPIRPYRMNLRAGSVGTGADDGNGQILGFGFSGTIDYETGVWEIDFAADPGDGVTIEAIYDLDVDAQTSLDKVAGSLLSKDIRAQIWALSADVGAFANFAFSQRFGRSAIDEVAADLSNEITRLLNTSAVLAIAGNIPTPTNPVTWNKTPGSGISYAEHKLTFIDGLADAEALLHSQSGASVANRFIAGKTAAALLRGMPDFVIAPDAATVSVGLYGYYDGIPVIRATGVVDDDEILLVSNAGNYFNAPLAYAPFMPLMVTNTVQTPSNPFRNTVAAGVWSGMAALNGNLTVKLAITS